MVITVLNDHNVHIPQQADKTLRPENGTCRVIVVTENGLTVRLNMRDDGAGGLVLQAGDQQRSWAWGTRPIVEITVTESPSRHI